MAEEFAAGIFWLMFGDTGFCVNQFVQSMFREFSGYLLEECRSFNNYMSRIRIYIENFFASASNVFSYLNFKQTPRLCSRNLKRQYEVANFLMNVRTTVYGNQFTEAL